MKIKFVKPIVLVTMYLVMAQAAFAQTSWTFDADLESWIGNTAVFPDQDIDVVWDGVGAMEMTYADHNAGEDNLDHPQVEVSVAWDASVLPFLKINYQTVGWPVSGEVLILVQSQRTDGTTVAYCLTNITVGATSAYIHLTDDDISGWSPYDGSDTGSVFPNPTNITTLTTLNIEFPEGNSRGDATPWFGASVLIDSIELTATPPPKWTFDADLEGWVGNTADFPDQDLDVVWDGVGAMEMTYADHNAGQVDLDHPQVEVAVAWDADDFPFLLINYQTVGWPVSGTVDILIQSDRTVGGPAFCRVAIDVAGTSDCINLVNDDTSGLSPYSGSLTTLNIEIPEGAIAGDTAPWLGASILIDSIELTSAPCTPFNCAASPLPSDISGPDGLGPDCLTNLFDYAALVTDWLKGPDPLPL